MTTNKVGKPGKTEKTLDCCDNQRPSMLIIFSAFRQDQGDSACSCHLGIGKTI